MSEPEPRPPRQRKTDSWSFVVFLLVVLVLAFLVFRPFLTITAVSASVAILLAPLHQRLAGALRGRRGLAAGLVVVLTAVVLLGPMLSYAVLISNQARGLLEWLRPHLDPEELRRAWVDLPGRYPWIASLKERLQLDQADLMKE